MKSLLSPLVFVLALSSSAFAAAPATLTLNDLRNHPERWPAEVTVPKDYKFQGGASAKKGQSAKVLELKGAEVVVEAANDLVFSFPVAESDFVAKANAAWAKLTPEQREITAATLLKDRSLWPLRVTCSAGFSLQGGVELAPGTEYELINYDREGVTLYSAQHNASLGADAAMTDLVPRARAIALVPAAERPSRIAAALGERLVDGAGRPVAQADFADAQIFVLYYGASWCGPCRQFSPDLVKFINEVGPKNPRMKVVLMSNDKKDADMFGYIAAEKMPWSAMPLSQLNKAPSLLRYVRGSIPHLVVVDRQGNVLADSYRGNQYVGPRVPMQALAALLETGIAR